ncbi:MAG: nuclear transport factor 2 family protein [Verrucomicrobiota bacterium]
MTGWILWESRPTNMITKKQEALLVGIEKRSPSRIERLLADDYLDRWGFDRADAAEACVDVGSQFLTLVITPEEVTLERDGDRAVVSAILRVGGKPIGPGGSEVTRRLNRLKTPFTFIWEKQSFLPASWRLIKIDNVELPTELYGYDPGDIRRAMQGE